MPAVEQNPDNEIRQLLRRINQAWVKGHPEDLEKCFHANMVMFQPDLQSRLEGRQNCVRSYEDFCGQAVIHDFREFEPAIDVCGNTAIATYRWEIRYEMNGESFNETGRDLFVFVREDGRWQAIWRAMILPQTQQ